MSYGRQDQHGDEAAGHPQVQGRVREGVEEAEGRHPGQDVRDTGDRQEHGQAPARPGRAAWERRGAGGAGAAVPVFGPVATAAGTGVGVDGYAVWQVFEGDAAAVAARVARLRGAGRL